uniref:Phospholipid scramblase n=1 Tax=Lygus hesperus TaxID=30085 RepID=A0A146KLW3_LYGHE
MYLEEEYPFDLQNHLWLWKDNNDEVVFDRNAVISVQPFSGNELRSPLPISTISGNDSRHSHILPISGLALLFDVQEITIEQTIELDDIVSVIESENRFLIKTDGQTIYGAHETSSAVQRLFCGTGRRFNLRLFDRSKQEALYMTRRLACSFPLLGCYLQRMDVFEPPCTYLGSIQQKWTIGNTVFSVRDMNDYEIFTITGPSTGPCCCHYDDTIFTTLDVAGFQVSTIEHKWDPKIMNYRLTVKYPNRAGLREKALLLAGGMLVEYMFFSTTKSNSLWCFNCHK